jgi:uncharacterized repeat protein (TIGR03803 family)
MLMRCLARPQRPGPRALRRRSHPPRVEVLEGRLAPASLAAVGAPYVSLNLPLLNGSGHPAADAAGDVFTTATPLQSAQAVSGGSVIKLAAGTGAMSLIAAFPPNDTPNNGLVLDGVGDVFGTVIGPDYPDGAVFKVVAATQAKGPQPIEILAKFDFGTTGSGPRDLLLDGNHLYGTTRNGGAPLVAGGPNGFGTVFSVPTGGGSAPSVLAVFDRASDPQPNGGLLLSDGVLYGTTSENALNTVFSVPVTQGGGTPKTLGTFTSGSVSVNGGLVVSDGNLHGTTQFGGSFPATGMVFRVPIGGGKIVTAPFGEGASPVGGLIQVGGTILGMAQAGGASGHGDIFSVDPTTLATATLASFNGADGGAPGGNLGLGADGNVYGVAQAENSATNNQVVVFRVGGVAGATLQFAPLPKNIMVNRMFAVQVDATGEPNGTLVTLTLGADPTRAQLSGQQVEPVINGVATFAGLSLNAPGIYTLVASSGAVVAVSPPLTENPAPQITFAWSGASTTSSLWSDPTNWVGGVAPLPFGSPSFAGPLKLVFPAGKPRAQSVDDIPSLVVDSVQIYGNYVLGGRQPVIFPGGGDLTLAPQVPGVNHGGAIVGFPMALLGGLTVNVGQGLALASTNVIAGPGGLTMAGPGELVLAVPSIYAGGTDLRSGVLLLGNNQSLGKGGLVLDGRAVLAVESNAVSLPNPVTVAASTTIVGDGKGLTLASVHVTRTAVLDAVDLKGGVAIQDGVSVDAAADLGVDGFLTLSGPISGRVSVGDPLGHSISGCTLKGADLRPGSDLALIGGFGLPLAPGLAIAGPVSGTGAISVSGGTLEVPPIQPSSTPYLASYAGTITLGFSARAQISQPLGRGPLVLEGGTLAAVGPVGLANSLTTLAGNFTLNASKGTIRFNGRVAVPEDRTLTIMGNVIFSLPLAVTGAAFLTVDGEGTLTLPEASVFKVFPKPGVKLITT